MICPSLKEPLDIHVIDGVDVVVGEGVWYFLLSSFSLVPLVINKIIFLFVCFDSLRPSQHFFIYVWVYQYSAGINVSCSRKQTVLSVGLEPETFLISRQAIYR